ncbi:MAG TPA: phytanoyl-CoA dioxygenase family protein [Pyrinomonadaceae bacterium]|jgi:phytanoyl-CoA hydroxylase
MNIGKTKERFEEDGFVIVQDFFGPSEVDEIEARLESYIRKNVPTLSADRIFRETNGAIKSMSRMNEEDEFFAAFKVNPKILDLVAGIFATALEEIVPENLQFFGKPAFEGSITPWHQDNGFQHYEPPESLMLWLALADVDEEMGCVCFAKGSHRLRVVKHIASGVLGFSQTVETPPDLQLFPEVKAVMRRGAISLHHCNTFHRSGANRASRSRPALAVNYRTKRAVANEEKRARVRAEVAKLIEDQENMS